MSVLQDYMSSQQVCRIFAFTFSSYLSLSLSLVTRTWERRDTTGPAPRAQSVTAIYWEGSLILFGGVLDGLAQNVTYILDIGTLYMVTN